MLGPYTDHRCLPQTISYGHICLILARIYIFSEALVKRPRSDVYNVFCPVNLQTTSMRRTKVLPTAGWQWTCGRAAWLLVGTPDTTTIRDCRFLEQSLFENGLRGGLVNASPPQRVNTPNLRTTVQIMCGNSFFLGRVSPSLEGVDGVFFLIW